MPKEINYDTTMQIRISNDLKEELNKKAKSNGKTLSVFIRELFEKICGK